MNIVLASKASKKSSCQGAEAEGCHELLKVGVRVPDMPAQRDEQTRNLDSRVILDEHQRGKGLVLASFFMLQILHACLGVFCSFRNGSRKFHNFRAADRQAQQRVKLCLGKAFESWVRTFNGRRFRLRILGGASDLDIFRRRSLILVRHGGCAVL